MFRIKEKTTPSPQSKLSGVCYQSAPVLGIHGNLTLHRVVHTCSFKTTDVCIVCVYILYTH